MSEVAKKEVKLGRPTKHMERYRNVGRPTKMNEETFQKLEWAFLHGCNKSQACLYADIAPSTLSEYLKVNPEYNERIETLQQCPSLQAKFNVVDAIENKDIDSSKWHLERRDEDYAKKSKTEISGSMGIDTEADRKAVIKEAIDHITGKNND